MIVTCPNPNCEKTCDQDLMTWEESLYIPFFCPFCEEFNWVERDAINMFIGPTKQIEFKIPPISLGSEIYIDNKEHQFFLERGTIVNKDHDHYRILFYSIDKKINQKMVWIPGHWVKSIPEGL